MSTFKSTMACIAMISFSFLFFSCKDTKRIAQKNFERDDAIKELSTKQNQLNECHNNLNLVRDAKKREYTRSALLMDSVGIIEKGSPIASAYIHKFDKEPIDIFLEYYNAKSDSEKQAQLFTILFLTWYESYDENKQTIAETRYQFKYLDNEQKKCMSNIAQLDRQITEYQNCITANEADISNLNVKTAELDKEIEQLNNTGIL